MAKADEANTEKAAVVQEQGAAKVEAKKPEAPKPTKGEDAPGADAGSGVDIDSLIENARLEGYERGFKEGKIEAEEDFAQTLKDREAFTEDGADQEIDSAYIGDNEKMVVGMLLATVVRLPRSLRAGGLKPVLDNLTAFVSQFEGVERYIASNLILAIAETRPDEISGGAYRYDVENSMKLIRGEDETHSGVVDTARANREAAERFARVSKKMAPPPEAVDPDNPDPNLSALPVMDGDADQNSAASRFYGRETK